MQNNFSTSESFDKVYLKLSRFEQIILQICSIIYEPSDSSTILRCLYTSKIPTNHSFQDYPRQINFCYKKLKNLGLLRSNWQCNINCVELASRQAVIENCFEKITDAVRKELPEPKAPPTGAPLKHSLRDLRIDLYSNDIEKFHRQLITLLSEQKTGASFSTHPMVTICNNPFDPRWFSTLPVHIQFFAMHEIVKFSIMHLAPLDEQLLYLQDEAKIYSHDLLQHPSFLYLLISVLLLQGKIEQAEIYIKKNEEQLDSLGLKGWLAFLQGKNSKALQFFEEDLSALHELNKRDDTYFTGFEGLIYVLSLLKNSQPESTPQINRILLSGETSRLSNNYRLPYEILSDIAFGRDTKESSDSLEPVELASKNSAYLLLLSLNNYLKKGQLYSGLEGTLKDSFESASKNGYHWLAMEFAEILARTTENNNYKELAENFRNKQKTITIADAIKHKERWNIALDELNKLNAKATHSLQAGTRRLAWMISMDRDPSSIRIIPKEQRLSDNGSWSRGRTLSAKRLFHQDDIDYLSKQDKHISSFIKRKQSATGGILYSFDIKPTLLAMADHRIIFWAETPQIHLEIKKGEPELRITESDESIRLTFYPVVHEEKIIIKKENQTLLKIFAVSEEQQKVAGIIGQYGVTVPKNEKNKLLQTIGRTASFLNVFSDISGIDTSHKKKESDSRIHMLLTPAGNGFSLKMFVRPFNSQGPYFLPGLGPVTIFSEINGEPLQTKRNLNIEGENAKNLLNACPLLHLYEENEMEWALPSPVECLEFLYCVKDDTSVILEWPQGEQLKISQSLQSSQCHLKITKKNKWFEVDGHIEMDEAEIMTISEALESIRHSNSRFIQLSDGKFIALAEELYNYLEVLETSTGEEHNSLRFLPFAFINFDEFSEAGFHIESDQDWKSKFKDIQNAEGLDPEIPSTLKASLRDYQIKGFRWMLRLSQWGAGACLADDMGIGKTIQALAVILTNAAKGPSLVIAPTSVCFNWQDEMDRFTPTLSSHSFNGENRRKTIEKLGPFDVFITSYGLLQQEEAIKNKKWQVIVLDEAQAIKNSHTKRSDAAMALDGAFKIITTGTPIENNLGELWNLFRFINPGLLGNIKQFNKRFASPIERDKNQTQKNKLKNLIAPFILRRLKSQVLQELPDRTEVNLFVDFSAEEKSFYEALRRRALEKVSDSNHQGRMRIQILAEIMKLRRACCNPRLILPETEIESSKLALFEETISELQANNHKTLVFSQFVGHLSLIKELLQKKNISYQYLDGSTPPRVRKTRVNAFQNGIGDVFLISLKAGGVGLNLTAANYVIHMDPWWNPAVEDQASDRAHRIGQKNPVTIYRLITRNSIEEKIIKLHQQKKDLANSLLEGTDIGESFSAEALLQLLQEC